MKKTYKDMAVPENACIFKTGTHTTRGKNGEDIVSHSFCRILCAPQSKYCPKHDVMMAYREDQKEARKQAKAALLRKGLVK